MGSVATTISIAFGWTLNQLTQWFRARQEDKKHLKMVLFNLFESYNLFMRIDMDRYSEKITVKVHERIPKEQQSEDAQIHYKTFFLSIKFSTKEDWFLFLQLTHAESLINETTFSS